MKGQYDGLAYRQLKDLVNERGVTVEGDQRTKKNMIAALELADYREEMQREAEEHEAQQGDEASSPLERKLAGIVPGPKQRMVFGRDYTVSRNIVNEQMKVGNLPADYVHGWASLTPANGEDVGRWTSLGWIRVTTDMVSSDPNDTDKIYVKNFEDWNGYVRHKDTVLVVADRRLVEERKAGYTERWNEKVEKMYGKRGELTKDQVGDPSEGSGRTYRRTAQWKAEDMVEGGG